MRLFGSVAVSTPRRASRAYRESVPAKARSPSPASGIGVAGGLAVKVAPSTRRSVPVERLTAYAVAPCCTTSSRSPAPATWTWAATSADEPSSRVSCPTWDEASQAAPDSSCGRTAG